jgi:hypothetical protein
MRPSICACVLAFGALLAGSSASAAEDIYRWVDAAGVIHYTQVAPRDAEWERVTPGARAANRRAPTLDNPRAGGDGGDEDSATRDAAPSEPRRSGGTNETPGLSEQQQAMQQRLEDQTAERLAELEQTRSQNCERAREQFQQFTTYARIRVEDEGGGTRVLTEEERQERIAEAREAIVLNCEDEG